MSRSNEQLADLLNRGRDSMRTAIHGRGRLVSGSLRLRDTPATPPVAERDTSLALGFLRDPATGGDGTGPNGQFQAEQARWREMRSSESLAERVGGTSWYHTIELPGGVTTPGVYDHRSLVEHYCLPARLDGKRALDVATFDGFWAFEMERRGASVTALDIPSTLDLDLPPAAMARAEREQIAIPVGTGFAIAAEALGSTVRRQECNVYDLSAATAGVFDFVHMADLLLHLERPWDALRHVRSATATGGTLHISEAFDPALRPDTIRYLGGWRDVEWWVPSLPTLCQWVADAGFAKVEVLASYQLGFTGNEGGFWRAVVRATAA